MQATDLGVEDRCGQLWNK